MWPILKNKSFPIILMPLNEADANFFYQIYGDPEIMQYIGDALTEKKAAHYFYDTLVVMSDPAPKYVTYVIRRIEDGENVGITGLTWFDPDNRKNASVGVMISQEFRRQKMAHMAKTLMIDGAFNQLSIETVYAYCQINNVPASTANMKLKLHKGRQVDNGVNRKLSQEWFINKTEWIGSISKQF